MSPTVDPEGRRALFSGSDLPGTPDDSAAGRAALFSTSGRRLGTLVVECSHCGAHSRIDYADFVRRHLPFWAWIPGREHSRLLRCPACERRTWLRVRWLS